jgi:two-component system alkaline phosphatase synthesis response regulator PhoP
MPHTRIAVIEDESDILEVMAYNLKRENFEVISSLRGDEGLRLVQSQLPSLVILDLMLPGMSGLDVCRELKASSLTRNIPVIMVSAKGEESDVVRGFNLGADDYVPKPFGARELIARVKAVLRRASAESNSQHINVLGLSIDIARHEATVDNQPLRLTATEFRILKQLALYPGRAFTREQLLDKALGEGSFVVDRNIDVHIRALRKKLGAHCYLIETVRSIGYRFRDKEVAL